MNDRILSFLGLCKKAGRMTLGADAVKSSIISGECRLILTANDISVHTENEVTYIAEKYSKRVIKLPYTKNEIGIALGKLTAVISVNDGGFAKKLVEMTAHKSIKEEHAL